MPLKPEEVSWAIQQEIEKHQEKLSLESVGYILQLGDGIARVHGLDDAMMSELVEFSNGTLGMVLNLEEDNDGVVLFGPDKRLIEQDIVKRTGKIAAVPVGDNLLGRVLDPLGDPIDGKGAIPYQQYANIEQRPPSVVQRSPVKEPLQTGIKAI